MHIVFFQVRWFSVWYTRPYKYNKALYRKLWRYENIMVNVLIIMTFCSLLLILTNYFFNYGFLIFFNKYRIIFTRRIRLTKFAKFVSKLIWPVKLNYYTQVKRYGSNVKHINSSNSWSPSNHQRITSSFLKCCQYQLNVPTLSLRLSNYNCT